MIPIRLVNKIEVDEVIYPIRSSAVDIIDVIHMLDVGKNVEALMHFYNDLLPTNIDEAIAKMMEFIHLYDDRPKPKQRNNETLFNYYYDFDLIYTALKKSYAVDLYTDNVHWFQFALMMKDSDGKLFDAVCKARSSNKSDIPKEQIPFYTKLRMQYPLREREVE